MSTRTSRAVLARSAVLVDKVFLEAIGWRGIRQRKKMLEELIPAAILRLKHLGRQVNVLDIAAGHGRYVLDAVAECTEQPASVRLQDYSDINVTAGRKQIAERRLPPSVSFHKADAFDADAPGRARPGARSRHRVGPLRALPRQCADRRVRWAGWRAPWRRARC